MCVPYTTDLIAGQHYNTGSVAVSDDGTSITVTVTTDAGYALSELHVYIGTAEVPLNNGGNPSPGQFPYGPF